MPPTTTASRPSPATSPTATPGPLRLSRIGASRWMSGSSTRSSRERSDRPAERETSENWRAAGGSGSGAAAGADGSVTVKRRSTPRFSNACTRPLGHVTVIRLMTVSAPRPKCTMGSLLER